MRVTQRLVAAVAVPLLATACGSTVAGQGATSGTTDGLGSMTVPDSTGVTAAGPDGVIGTGDDGLSVPGTAPRAGNGTSVATGRNVGPGTAGNTSYPGTVPGSAAPTTAAAAPGLTDTTITVGISYATNSRAAAAALGVENVNMGDPLAEQKVIIKDINDHGGILGRQVKFVAHAIDATSTAPYDQQAQEECADFHQDHHVFAVLDEFGGDVLRACTHKAGAVQVAATAQMFTTASTFQRYPYFVAPAGISQDRIAAAWTPALVDQNYFTPWNIATGKPGGPLPVRVGVLTLDTPEMQYAVNNILAPALKAAGHPIYDTAFVKAPDSTADNGATLSQIQSAVLRFRNDNITHFLPFDSAAGLSLYFGKNASSQHYYPRFGLNSGDGVQVLIDAGLMPTDELNGAVGYGWESLLDVDNGHNPPDGKYSNAARQHCVELMKKNGFDMSGPAQRGAVEYCDQFYFLKAAMEAGGEPASRDSFLAGVNRLGTSFVAGETFVSSLAASQHDGVAASRYFDFDNGCGCFLYTSGVRRLS